METLLGNEITEYTLGLLYICKYDYNNFTLEAVKSIQFESEFAALQAYANIPNPESQMAGGKDRESFIKEVTELHRLMKNPEWQKELANTL